MRSDSRLLANLSWWFVLMMAGALTACSGSSSPAPVGNDGSGGSAALVESGASGSGEVAGSVVTDEGGPSVDDAAEGAPRCTALDGLPMMSYYLSDLDWVGTPINGRGPVEKDMSNGEEVPGDGGPLSINNVKFAKGLGAHANSTIEYDLGHRCTTFAAKVGHDDEVGYGSSTFEVWVDGVSAYKSPMIAGPGIAAQVVSIDVSCASKLTLVVTDAGNGVDGDHADWADAQVTCADRPGGGADGSVDESIDASSTLSEASADAAATCWPSTASPNLAVGGTVSASNAGIDALDSAAMVFDDNIGTKWFQNANPTPWIAYEFAGAAAYAVTTYTVTSANDGVSGVGMNVNSDPKDWQFQGSNDPPNAASLTWVTLDTRTNQSFASRLLTQTYTLVNMTPYHRYRLLVTANGGAPEFQIAEFQLFGPGTPVFSVDDAVEGTALSQFNYSHAWVGHTRGDNTVIPYKYGRSNSWSNTTDEFVTITFSGTQVKLFAVTDVTHGIPAISIDAGPETAVDFYAAYAVDVLLYTSPVLCARRHTLKVRVSGNKNLSSGNTYASVDRVQVIP